MAGVFKWLFQQSCTYYPLRKSTGGLMHAKDKQPNIAGGFLKLPNSSIEFRYGQPESDMIGRPCSGFLL